MDGCTVKQKFVSDSKMTTSLGTKVHLKNTKHCVLITVPPIFKVSIRHQRAKEKRALKLNKHNQFNHTPKTVKPIYFIIL